MTDHIAEATRLIDRSMTCRADDGLDRSLAATAQAHALLAIAEALQPDVQIVDPEIPSDPGAKPEPVQVDDWPTVDDSRENAAQNALSRGITEAAGILGISHVKLSTRYDIASRVVAEIRASAR